MRLVGNFLWFILGGFISWISWVIMGIFACISIVGIPWGKACFVMANFSAWPFGREVIGRKELTLKDDIGTGVFGSLGNIIWFIFAGFWLAILHVIIGIAWFCTIIGIPFGIQYFKLAGFALVPIGKTIVSKEVAAVAVRTNAEDAVAALRQPKQSRGSLKSAELSGIEAKRISKENSEGNILTNLEALKTLSELKERGDITDEEFAAQKKKIFENKNYVSHIDNKFLTEDSQEKKQQSKRQRESLTVVLAVIFFFVFRYLNPQDSIEQSTGYFIGVFLACLLTSYFILLLIYANVNSSENWFKRK